MQKSLLPHLRCPLNKGRLTLEVIEEKVKHLDDADMTVIETGILYADDGMVYPVIKGVPRLLLESFLDNEAFFTMHLAGFADRKKKLLTNYGDAIFLAIKRNKLSKKSFSVEWKLLESREHINVWHINKEAFSAQLFNELGIPEYELKGKQIIDIGCGHGRSTNLLSVKADLVIGMDMGLSVIHAEEENASPNTHYLQADLHYLPFEERYFDIVYCSGVLHHTENTRRSFDHICKLVKNNGLVCVWLYAPFNNRIQQVMLSLRKITVPLPMTLQYWLYMIFLVPIHKLVSWLKGTRRHWREIMINQVDLLSPQYRHEHTAEEVSPWFSENGFTDIHTTTVNRLGFSMKGIKQEVK